MSNDFYVKRFLNQVFNMNKYDEAHICIIAFVDSGARWLSAMDPLTYLFLASAPTGGLEHPKEFAAVVFG